MHRRGDGSGSQTSGFWRGVQVSSAGVQAGEEQALRRRLRQMETRQSSVQRCALVAAAQAGLQEGVRAAQTQLNAVLAEEQAHADALAGGLRRPGLLRFSSAAGLWLAFSEMSTAAALCAQVYRASQD